jgi:hypothetical protein
VRKLVHDPALPADDYDDDDVLRYNLLVDTIPLLLLDPLPIVRSTRSVARGTGERTAVPLASYVALKPCP